MFDLNYITVYVETQYFQPDRIFVDENGLDNSLWSQVRGCSTTNNICGYITRVQLTTAGDHRLYHLDQHARLGVSVYGFTRDNSYGYPGGMKLTPLQRVSLKLKYFSSNGMIVEPIQWQFSAFHLQIISMRKKLGVHKSLLHALEM